MDNFKIPEDHVVPMEAVADGVRGLRIIFVNVFAITHQDGSWTLIDTGMPFSAGIIHSWADKEFGTAPRAIVLTHGHFDHVSSAGELADRWDVPIWAHPLELPYLTGKEEYPPPNPKAGGGLMSLLSPIYPRGPTDLGSRLRALPFADTGAIQVPDLPGWQVLHTPGHTPGHLSFFRPEDKMLMVGDAFCTTKPESFFEAALAQQVEIHGPPAYFTSDWESARNSVQRLAELQPAIVAPGHGKPLGGRDVAEAIRALAANFDQLAMPANERM